MNRRVVAPLFLFLLAGVLWAHPMGNFSVSHYSRIELSPGRASIRYVLDLAEIPAFELLQSWKADASTPQAELDRHAAEQAREWARHLQVSVGGHAETAAVDRASTVLDKGAGGMPILRVIADLHVDAGAGTLTYEDGNYPDRAGWKEIVVGNGADRSKELTAYPQDPLLAPPQELKATVKLTAVAPVLSEAVPAVAAPVEPAASASSQPGQSAPGMVVRGDFLSKLLHQGEIGWGMMLVGMAVAFGHQRFLFGIRDAVPVEVRAAGEDLPGAGGDFGNLDCVDRRDAVFQTHAQRSRWRACASSPSSSRPRAFPRTRGSHARSWGWTCA
jgi:nickel/cobalt exporter